MTRHHPGRILYRCIVIGVDGNTAEVHVYRMGVKARRAPEYHGLVCDMSMKELGFTVKEGDRFWITGRHGKPVAHPPDSPYNPRTSTPIRYARTPPQNTPQSS